MRFQLEAIFQKRLHHECNRVWNSHTESGGSRRDRAIRRLSLEVPAIAVDPIRTTQELLIIAIGELNDAAQSNVRRDEAPSRLVGTA